jgi:Rrf2 family protein
MGLTVLFSRKAEIGLKASLLLATKESEEVVDVNIIATELQVPKMFAAKVLQKLALAGIIGSKKGKNGGFFLPKGGEKVKLIKILEVIDGLDFFNRCVFGFPNCSEEHPCPVHHYWGNIRQEIYEMLSNLSIGEVKQETLNKLDSIKNLS